MTVLLAPTAADLEALAKAALAEIPEPLRRHTEGLVIQVHDFPDDEVCADLALESPFDLLGLYQGLPIGERSVSDTPGDLDRVFYTADRFWISGSRKVKTWRIWSATC